MNDAPIQKLRLDIPQVPEDVDLTVLHNAADQIAACERSTRQTVNLLIEENEALKKRIELIEKALNGGLKQIAYHVHTADGKAALAIAS